MYNRKDIQFTGKYDYDREEAEKFASSEWAKTFSVGIFQWSMNKSNRLLKRSKVSVRVSGPTTKKEEVFKMAESVVLALDAGEWDGRKTVVIK